MSLFAPSFPYSNMGFAQLFLSENAECVCQALKQVFEFTGGMPARIVFDNATGVGRRSDAREQLVQPELRSREGQRRGQG